LLCKCTIGLKMILSIIFPLNWIKLFLPPECRREKVVKSNTTPLKMTRILIDIKINLL